MFSKRTSINLFLLLAMQVCVSMADPATEVLPVSGISSSYSYDDDFKDAEKTYNQFRTEFLDIKMVNAQEASSIVSAICEAEEDDRSTASSAASARAKSSVTAKFKALENIKDDAEKDISKAITSVKSAKANSAEYKKNGSKIDRYLDKLEDFAKDVSTKWGSIEKMTKGIRGGNHPVVGWLMEIGQAAHEDRQESSRFHATEFVVGSAGRIDCLIANGSELLVVELKPCNTKATQKGITQLKKYIKELQARWSTYKSQLVSKNAKFSGVTKISGRCDCYTICPEINDDGEFEKGYIKWTEGTATVTGGALK
jgi:hypothetical protein